jgi:hypothetical protein
MKTPSIAYHVGRCNPQSPFCKSLKGKLEKTLELEEDEEVIIVVVRLKSEISEKIVSPAEVSKPQPPLYHFVIQSPISERIETPSESLKPNRPTRHML